MIVADEGRMRGISLIAGVHGGAARLGWGGQGGLISSPWSSANLITRLLRGAPTGHPQITQISQTKASATKRHKRPEETVREIPFVLLVPFRGKFFSFCVICVICGWSLLISAYCLVPTA